MRKGGVLADRRRLDAPLISVVMPVYNVERYVAEAVESILTQTFQDFEFLIFDDGSNDGSLTILKEYANHDKRIQLFAKPHQGYVPWLNEGIKMARGEFIARMDADDVSLPQRFVRQMQHLCRHPDCVAVGCDTLMIDPDGDALGKVIHDVEHKAIESDLLNGGLGVIAHPTCMMRRSTLLAIGGYREEFESIEDFDLWLRLAELGCLANLPEVLLKYRVHYTNVVFTQVDRQRQHADRIINEARLRRGLKPLPHSIWSYTAPTFVERHQSWASQALGSGYQRTALKHAFISLRKAPFSPRSWLTLCVSALPKSLRQLLKATLVSAGLWTASR
ncbi:MAG: glycosyltransferase [Betaproteobacteria bacterium]|nr:glycosyltransferase [Betaproteobacteria bacterium]